MIPLAIAAVAVLLTIGARWRIEPAPTLLRVWSRSWAPVAGYVRSAPATFAYLALISVTTWVLVGVTPSVADQILHQHSSNLHELSAKPMKVLIQSAFWLDSYVALVGVAVAAVLLAPVERWLGTARWIIAFAAGHIGATLVSGSALWLAIRSGHASSSLGNTIDVGASYGFAAIAGLMTYGLRGRMRIVWASAGLTVLGIGVGSPGAR